MSSDDELLDVLDESGSLTGETRTREEVHRSGAWHRVFHLWIVRDSGTHSGTNNGTLLLQRRSLHKDLEPNKVDVTVGGHLRAGESVFDAVREVEEEIGLEVQPERLVHLGSWRSERSYPEARDREFQEVFALICDWPLDRYSLDCREVYILYELPLSRALALYREGAPVPAAGYDCQYRINDALLVEDDLIEQARASVSEQLAALSTWLASSQTQPADN
ncbi:MAG: NUDIX domain-containing protein [Trueperaceae bacterium]